MNRYKLPTSVEIAGKQCFFKSDFRDILEIFKMFNDPDLLEEEKSIVALEMFYENESYLDDVSTAIQEMFLFFNAGEHEPKSGTNSENDKPTYDWEQDFNIIIAPINRILGKDVRSMDYLHWWTFLSAFMEIGECTFSTYVAIRDKLNKGKKLEKYEEKIYKENRDKILLKKKYDSTTQDLLNEIMGRR